MMDEEHLYRLALYHIHGIGPSTARILLEKVGSATRIFKHSKEVADAVPGIAPQIIKALDCPDIVRTCEKEMEFADKKGITCLINTDSGYPARLSECNDPPMVLFYLGNADLNSRHVISVVGTRRATDYGKGLCESFIRDLQTILPDALIVSGLAYGIDIATQRASLKYGLDTVGVLAHGLDRIYPAAHRTTAAEMVNHGGLLTEYPSGTNPDRQNFVMRNRIIAGMSDAVIVVESTDKGGAMITAGIARSYNRECFTFPGRVGDEYSAGCNRMIRLNQAALIESAEDLVEAMNWVHVTGRGKGIPVQRELFPTLSEEEQGVMGLLVGHEEGLRLSDLNLKSDISLVRLSSLLLELEIKGLVSVSAGGFYKCV